MSLARWWPLRRLPGNFGSPLARFTHPQLSARSTSGAAQSQQATAAAPSRPVGAAGVPPPPPSPPVASSQPVGAKRGPALTPAGMVATRSAAAAQAAEECRLERVVANLQACCSAAPVAPPVSSKFAAVLVPLFEDPASGEVHVVLNQRSSKLKTHSGEVCFPGGKRDPGDADDIATALREAQEELGLDPGCVRVVACLPPFLSKHLLSVTPVVGVIPPRQSFTPNPQEVAAVFTVPLRRFLEAGPGYSHRDVEWQPGLPYRLHYFEHRHGGRSFTIWGLTAGMLIVVAERALGRRPAFRPDPPNALPYHRLAFEGGRLVFRAAKAGEAGGDALGLAAAASAEERPPSGVVSDREAAAALGEGDQQEDLAGGSGGGTHGSGSAGSGGGRG